MKRKKKRKGVHLCCVCPAANKRCNLHCQSKETRAVALTDRVVLDGTRCSYKDPHSVCVRGECEVRRPGPCERDSGPGDVNETFHLCVCVCVNRKWAATACSDPRSRRTNVECVEGITPAAKPSRTPSHARRRSKVIYLTQTTTFFLFFSRFYYVVQTWTRAAWLCSMCV